MLKPVDQAAERYSYQLTQAALHALAGYRIAWFTAPPGFGKREASQSWLHNQHKTAITIELADDSPATALHAQQQLLRAVREHSLESRFQCDATDDSAEALCAELAETLERVDQPLAIAIHLHGRSISAQTQQWLLQLLGHHSAKLAIAVTSTLPIPDAFHTLWLDNRLAEVNANTLRLSSEESRCCLEEIAGHSFSEVDYQHASAFFTGWYAGLKMLALYCKDNQTSVTDALSAPYFLQRFYGYLSHKLLAFYPPHEKDILVGSALHDSARPERLSAVFGGNLADIERMLTLLGAVKHEQAYYWPPYLAKFLRHEALRDDAFCNRAIAPLFHWDISQQHWADAVNLVTRWGNDTLRLEAAKRCHRKLHNQGSIDQLEQLFAKLTPALLEPEIELRICRAWLLIESGETISLDDELQSLTHQVETAGVVPAAEQPHWLAEVGALYAYRHQIHRELPQAYSKAAALEGAFQWRSYGCYRAQQIATISCFELGHFNQAEQMLERLLVKALGAGHHNHVLWAYARMSWLLSCRNLFESALNSSQRGIALAQQHQLTGKRVFELYHACIDLMLKLDRLNELPPLFEQAQKIADTYGGQSPIRLTMLRASYFKAVEQFPEVALQMEELERCRADAYAGGSQLFVDHHLIDWWCRTDDRAKLERWLSLPLPYAVPLGRNEEMRLIQLVKANWAVGNEQQALNDLNQLLEIVQDNETLKQIEALDLAVCLYYQFDRPVEWQKTLSQLISLTLPLKYVIPFRLNAHCYRQLLEQYDDQGSLPERQFVAFVKNLLKLEPDEDQIPAHLMSVGVTPSEYKVLALIKQGHSNREICDALHISEATLKTHINRSYKKLGVSSRKQAQLALEHA